MTIGTWHLGGAFPHPELVMIDNLVRIAVSLAVSLGALIVGLAVLAALHQRGIDPVGRLAGLFAPRNGNGGNGNGNGNTNNGGNSSTANAPV